MGQNVEEEINGISSSRHPKGNRNVVPGYTLDLGNSQRDQDVLLNCTANDTSHVIKVQG